MLFGPPPPNPPNLNCVNNSDEFWTLGNNQKTLPCQTFISGLRGEFVSLSFPSYGLADTKFDGSKPAIMG